MGKRDFGLREPGEAPHRKGTPQGGFGGQPGIYHTEGQSLPMGQKNRVYKDTVALAT